MYLLRKMHDPVVNLRSVEFNIDNGSGTTADDVLGNFPLPMRVLSVRAVYTVATDTAGAASANFKLGIAAGGATIVAATALQISKAIGDRTDAVVLAAGEILPANTTLWVRHTGIAATEAGNYYVQVELAIAAD